MAVIRLHLSDTHPDPTLPWADGDTSVYAYLIDHPDGLILVDTGVGEGSALIDALYHPDHHDLVEAIERTGHHIGDVRTVINSHLHFDHCGHNHLFPSVPILVQRREYQAVHHGSYTVEEWVDFPGARIQQLDGDHQVAPGVRVVSTPGHTTGHQSVVVDDSEGRTVICAQAAYTAADFGSGRTDPHSTEAADVQLASIDRLRSLRPDRVCFSHDATDSDAGCSGVVSATSRPGLAWPKAGLAWPKAARVTDAGTRGHKRARSPACSITSLLDHRPARSPACSITRRAGRTAPLSAGWRRGRICDATVTFPWSADGGTSNGS